MNRTTSKSYSATAFVRDLLAPLEARERHVISARYGLSGDAPETLQAIGNHFRITRERVRQLEAGALKLLRKRSAGSPYLATFMKATTQILKANGGVQTEAELVKSLQSELGEQTTPAIFANQATFLLELSQAANRFSDSYGNWHPHWYLSESHRKRAHDFVAKASTAFAHGRAEAISPENGGRFIATLAKSASIPLTAAKAYLATSRRFATGPFGHFGLTDWAEVQPKTARDWAYVILKRAGKPLHFTQIAQEIATNRQRKRTNVQTVHNELIKDNRFVLVGRGLYTLSEFGFLPGTAREIIAHVLKSNGPLGVQEVIARVRKQRLLKDGTILINLQNKKYFQSLPNGTYTLREA